MKYNIFILMIVGTGCSSASKLNCDQACAMENMVCTGQTLGSAKTLSARGRIFGSARTESTDYHCAHDEAQSAKIQAIKDSMMQNKSSNPLISAERCTPIKKADDWEVRRSCEAAGL